MAAKRKAATRKRKPATRKKSAGRTPAHRNRLKWMPKFLEHLAEHGNVTEACRQVAMQRKAAYKARDLHPEFARDWDDACDAAAEVLEFEARRRAYSGVDEPVFHQGERVGAVRKFSDLLLIFLLKGIKPDKYRERRLIEKGLNAEDVAKLMAELGEDVKSIIADPAVLEKIQSAWASHNPSK